MRTTLRTLLVLAISIALGLGIYATGSVVPSDVVGKKQPEGASRDRGDHAENGAEEEEHEDGEDESGLGGLTGIANDVGLIGIVTIMFIGTKSMLLRRVSHPIADRVDDPKPVDPNETLSPDD